MTRRLHGWDYSQRAIYMVTVTLAERGRPVLAGWPENLGARIDLGARMNLGARAEARDSRAGSCASPRAAKFLRAAKFICPLTPLGETVLKCWREIPSRWPMVSLIEAVVMPDHFHGILFVEAQLPAGKTLGNVIGSFKSRSTSLCLGARIDLGARAEAQDRAEARDGGRYCASPRAAKFSRAAKFWSEGFQDTILLHEGQLAAMRDYIRENPDRLAEKRANPELFRRVANLALPLAGGRMTGHFEAIGNRHLLERPLHQVQCSRQYFAYRRIPKPGGGLKIARDAAGAPIVERTSPDFEARLEAALDAAAHGAVVLSPCISDGERQIAREALMRNLPLVAMRNMGFSKLQKPPGRYFEACAEGRLLMIAPAAWPYATQEKPMNRFDATAMNRLCQWLAGEDAIDIDYHGMTPANIDELARAAAMAPVMYGRRGSPRS